VTETVLYSFGSFIGDGLNPEAGLIFDKEGALYGTTSEGGTGNAGTVFKLMPPVEGQTAWTKTVLYNFCSQLGCSDGYEPRASLIFDKEGALYGTTEFGGTGNNGIVFKLTPPAKGVSAWTPTVLHSFVGGDGANPIFGGLIFDKQGALHGTTYRGGTGNNGIVFKLTPPAKGLTAWTETVLHGFTGGSDGANPYAGLIANHGALYGTTYFGGTAGNGTVFKLTP
jgi:uncharacterized repeat protein (TIGR03803 family)